VLINLSRRAKLVLVVGVLAIIALAVGLTLWLTSGDKEPPPLSHQAYAELFAGAQISITKISVLKNWPKPYQIYHDSYQHQCYEWWDKGAALYSLCFKKGTLVNKDIL
jgi:hypothetical protein